jgi:hypothetical protein
MVNGWLRLRLPAPVYRGAARSIAVRFAEGANAVRPQLHAIAYNLGNFLRTLAMPEPIKDWSLTS